MPKVELELAGLKLSGVVEEEFPLLPVAAVLAAGGVLRPEQAPPRPQVAPPAPHPLPPTPPPARLARLTPPAPPRTAPSRPAGRQALARAPDHDKTRGPGRKRGGKNWNRGKKKLARANGHP